MNRAMNRPLTRAMNRVLPLVLVVACCSNASLRAQETRSLGEWRDVAFAALGRGDSTAAITAADAILRDFPEVTVAARVAGDVYLRAGKIDHSIEQFERYIKQVPEHEPELWQYGIALALVGRYDDGRKLFELHRTVNPRDVENALWHFYCVAKASSPERARALVLPAPGDRRVPMAPLLSLYRGEADEAAVRAAVAELPEDSRAIKMAGFYADLYLAMLADAEGDRQRASELAARAAKIAEVNYMTDVGRIYQSTFRDAAP